MTFIVSFGKDIVKYNIFADCKIFRHIETLYFSNYLLVEMYKAKFYRVPMSILIT